VGEIWKNGNEVCGSRYCRLSMKRHYLFFSEVSVDHYRLKSNIIFRGDVLLTSGRSFRKYHKPDETEFRDHFVTKLL